MGITELCGLSATLARLTTRCRSGLGTSHMCGSCHVAADTQFAPWTGLCGSIRRRGSRPRRHRKGSEMNQAPIIVAGIPIPSDSPAFLAVVGVHVLAGLAAVLTGLGAMVARKGRGRHSAFGTLYYRSLLIVCVTMAGLLAVRWAEDYHLFVLGALAFAAAFIGRGPCAVSRSGSISLAWGRRTSCCSPRSTWTTARTYRSGGSYRHWRSGCFPPPSGSRSSWSPCDGIPWRKWSVGGLISGARPRLEDHRVSSRAS